MNDGSRMYVGLAMVTLPIGWMQAHERRFADWLQLSIWWFNPASFHRVQYMMLWHMVRYVKFILFSQLDDKPTTHFGGNTRRMEYNTAVRLHSVYCHISAKELDSLTCFDFLSAFLVMWPFLFSIHDAWANMLNDNCEHIFGGAPASRADTPATDCVWNTQRVCFIWISVYQQTVLTGMGRCDPLGP